MRNPPLKCTSAPPPTAHAPQRSRHSSQGRRAKLALPVRAPVGRPCKVRGELDRPVDKVCRATVGRSRPWSGLDCRGI
eukprot:scaffold1535_cov382-Prasinococcus_capsulatus_cf.AAC.8